MVIIIPGIAWPTIRWDLQDFVEKVLGKLFRLPFSAPPQILSCRILSVTDRFFGVTERHGLISLTPDGAAQRVMRKLNGYTPNGKRVGVEPSDSTATETVYVEVQEIVRSG